VSGYIRSKLFETTFDGDAVKVRLRPMSFEDFLKFKSVNEKDDGEVALAIFKDIVPKYVEEISGLYDVAGAAVTVEEVFGAAYFLNLVSEMGVALLNAATVERPQKPVVPSAS
jgi:hypothetical protein